MYLCIIKDVTQHQWLQMKEPCFAGESAGVRGDLEAKRDELVEDYARERDELLEDLLPPVAALFQGQADCKFLYTGSRKDTK